MDSSTIIYVIIAFCVIFGIISAYLIYSHVQEEKEAYFRAKLRRQKDQEGPSNYLSEPIPGPKKPLMAVMVDPDPDPEPEKQPDAFIPPPPPVFPPAPEPVQVPPELEEKLEVNEPPEEKKDNDRFPVAAAAAAGAALGLGAAAAATSQLAQPKAKPKRKGKLKRSDDFDDYRNGSPTALPPPKPAPPAAQYRAPPEASKDVFSARSGDSIPRTADRDGLMF